MIFGNFIKKFDCMKDGQIILDIEGVSKAQEISMDAAPLMEGLKNWIVAFFWIEDGVLGVRLEQEERPF